MTKVLVLDVLEAADTSYRSSCAGCKKGPGCREEGSTIWREDEASLARSDDSTLS